MTAQYTDEGLKVLLTEDWFIYVVRESDNLIFAYNTEMWPEWLDVAPNGEEQEPNSRITVTAMIPFAHNYTPYALANMSCDYCRARSTSDHMTLEQWENRNRIN